MPAFRPTSIRIHDAVEAAYSELEAAASAGKKPEASVWKALTTAVSRLKTNAQWGEVIPQRKIPNALRARYNLANLYCIDLAGFRRCFYTIEGRVVILLDIVDHAQYDKWFPNRGK